MAEQQPKTLEELDALINKEYGTNTIIKMDGSNIERVPVYSTKIPGLDYILGGGYGKGRIVEIIGNESSGKTTMTLQAIASVQEDGGTCGFIDAEHALDIYYAQNLGVNIEALRVTQPETGEQSLSIVEMMARSGLYNLVVVDSVSALTPQAEIEGEMGQSHVGLQARLMSQAMRKLRGACNSTGTTVIFINQIRCLDENTLVLKNGRLSPLKEISVTDKIFDKTVLERYDTQEVEGYKLITKYRPPISISQNHQLPIISKRHADAYSIVKGQDIQVKDWLITPIIHECPIVPVLLEPISLTSIVDDVKKKLYHNTKIPTKIPTYVTPELCRFMGMYVADGSFQVTKSIQFSELNRERYHALKDTILSLFDAKDVGIYEHRIYLHGKFFLEFFKALGLKRYGKNKTIPQWIVNSSQENIIAFIQGLCFDSHGFTNKNSFIITMENEEAIIQLAELLYYFGIFGDLRKDRESKYNRLYISSTDAIKFYRQIGFLEATKQQHLSDLTESVSARGKYDVVPRALALEFLEKAKTYCKQYKIRLCEYPKYANINQCSWVPTLNFSRLILLDFIQYLGNPEELKFYYELIQNNRFTQIQEILSIEIDAVDIEVDKDNTFIASTYLSHNSKIGVVYGNPEVGSGGNALKFYASQRLDVRKKKVITETTGDKEAVATNIRVKVIKNKIAPPFKEAEFVIRFGEGIDVVANVLDFAVSYGIVKKAGSWYSYKEERIGQGKEKATACLKENSHIYTEIEKLVYQELNTKMNKPIVKRQRKTDVEPEPELEPIEEE